MATGLGLAAHLAAGGQIPGVPIVTALAALLGMAASAAASIAGGVGPLGGLCCPPPSWCSSCCTRP
ncbi:MAG TPA: hypothetical protein VFS79_11615 [Arthrobacter sp.]|nr:hypothetical protein [Arthrobacter sp.]